MTGLIACLGITATNYMQVANILPDPFPIPLFRKSTIDSLEQKKYTTDDRKYMVRVLSTMILTHVQRATMNDCAQVSKALTRKYPFLGDYVSVICVCLCVRLLTVKHTTVDREIFTVKNFSPVIWVAKI